MAGDGQALLLLEGLRLHLDVQLEPEGAETAPMPVGTFGGRPRDATATERAAPRRASGRASPAPAYQQWVVLTALASLLLALGSWWVGGEPAQPAAESTNSSSSLSSELEPARTMAAPLSVAPVVPPPAAPAEPPVVVVPVLAPPPQPAATTAVPARQARPAATAPALRPRPPTSGAAQPPALAAERAVPPRATAGGEQARAAAPRLANSDLLYLFGDTK